MTPLFWRFFTYIWGAIIGTTLFVLLLVVWRNDPPPGLVPVAETLPLVREALARAPDPAAWLKARPSLAASLTLTAAPCGVDTIGSAPCLRLDTLPEPLKGPWKLLPFLIPLLSGMAIAMAAAWELARRFLRPIGRIDGALKALAQGALHTRIGRSEEPALEGLSRAFDQAAGHLQELTESRTRLFHDISHEIRSPLARLTAQTALLRQNPGRLDAALPRLEQDIARMDRLIDQILTLARLEHGAEIAPLPLDLVELLDPMLEDARIEAQSLGKSVTYDGPETLPFHGDPELLHRAIENILRNAIRHAPVATLVRLRLDPGPRLTIEDAGPGVPPERLEAIFQPFHREGTAGTGLGLAIAARAVHLHGGTIRAENRAGGFAVTVTLGP